VVASVLAMVVSLNIGLRGTLLVGMGIYAVAWLAMIGIRVALNRAPVNESALELAAGD
jgi:hypothetical protein